MDIRIAGIIGKVFQFGIGIIGAIMFLMILTGNAESVISPAISLSLYSIYIAAGIAVLFGIYHFAINVKDNKKSLIGIVAFLLIIIIARTLAKGQTTSTELIEKAGGDSQVLMADTGLYMFYILISLTVLSIIVSEVSRLFK